MITRWPIPIVVEPGVFVILGLPVVLGCVFALFSSITIGLDHPSAGDVAVGIAAAMLWPVAIILHELGHAAAGIAVGRPPVWASAGMVPIVVLTPPPVERWACILVSAAGPVVEIAAGLLLIATSPVTGTLQFLTDPWAMVGGVCLLNGALNLLPWPKTLDGGKLWCAARGIAAARLR